MELGKNIPGAAQIWVNLDLFLNTNVAIFSLTSNTFHLQDNLCFDLFDFSNLISHSAKSHALFTFTRIKSGVLRPKGYVWS